MKRAIPVIPRTGDHHAALSAIKENIEILSGQRGGKMTTLPSNASLSDVIVKVNEIIERMQ